MTRGFEIAALFFLAVVIGCMSQSVTLIHPQSGASAKCDASGFGLLSAAVGSTVQDCVEKAEREGYVEVERLTPEQRADLERRGLLRKEEAPRRDYY